jgi:hypothetical protein
MTDPKVDTEATAQSTTPPDAPLDVSTAVLAAVHSAREATSAEIEAILRPFEQQGKFGLVAHAVSGRLYDHQIKMHIENGYISTANSPAGTIYALTRSGTELLRDRIVQLEGKSETLRTIAEILAAARRDEHPIVNQNN